MIDSFRLFQVKPARVTEFVAAFRNGGIWHECARRLPGFVATDLLQSRALPQIYLSIDFWLTESASMQAHKSPQVLACSRLLSDLTIWTVDLGVFAFPHGADEENALKEDFVTSVIRRIDRWMRP